MTATTPPTIPCSGGSLKLATALFLLGLLGGNPGGLGAQSWEVEPALAALSVSGGAYTETGQLYATSDPDTSGVAAYAEARVTLTEPRVVVSGGSTDLAMSLLWGTGSGLLASQGARLTVLGGSVRTLGLGAAAVFARDQTEVLLNDLSLTTLQDSSWGIAVAEASVTMNRGTLQTTGAGSSGLWAGGRLVLNGTAVTALGAEAAVLVGGGEVLLKDAVVLGSRNGGVLFSPVYRDGTSGTSTLTVQGGSLTALEGPLFASFRGRSVINLKQTALFQRSGLLAQSTESTMVLGADAQMLQGDLKADALGTILVTLRNGSTWEGAANPDKAAKEVSITLEGGCLWKVTADSWISTLRVEGNTAPAAVKQLVSGGHSIWYKTSVNTWLGGRTIVLDDGGALRPY